MTQQGKRPNIFLFLVLLLTALALFGRWVQPRETQPSYAEVKELFEQERVRSFTVADTRLTLTLRDSGTDARRTVV